MLVVVLENPDRFAIRLTEQISSIDLFAVTAIPMHRGRGRFRNLGLNASRSVRLETRFGRRRESVKRIYGIQTVVGVTRSEAQDVSLRHQTNRAKVYCYSRQRQELFKSFSAPLEETWRATLNLQMFDDGWKIVGSHARIAEMSKAPRISV